MRCPMNGDAQVHKISTFKLELFNTLPIWSLSPQMGLHMSGVGSGGSTMGSLGSVEPIVDLEKIMLVLWRLTPG